MDACYHFCSAFPPLKAVSLSFFPSLSVSAPPPPLPPSIYPNKSHLCLTHATFHSSIKAEFSFPSCFFLLLCEPHNPCYKTDLLSGSELSIIKDNTFINSYHLAPHGFNNFSRKLHSLMLALALLSAADYVLTFHHHYLNSACSLDLCSIRNKSLKVNLKFA